MISYWEQKHFTEYDFIVIGSGITGLSLAAELKERNHNAKVLVLEKGLFPSGASTKNAGFACFGSVSELAHDLKVMGEEELVSLVKNRINGLAALRNRLGDTLIDFQNNGGYEMVLNGENENLLHQIATINQLLYPVFSQNVFSEDFYAIERFGFANKLIKTVIVNPFEGQIDTGLMMSSLIEYVTKLGVKIITGAQVDNYQIANGQVFIACSDLANNKITFSANKIAFCTNAFTSHFFPHLIINPGRGQVLVTKPIKNLKVNGTFSFDEGYYYFRNIDNRILFGGGRNIDFEMENTLQFGINATIQDKLIGYLQNLILPTIDFEIDKQWCGLMAFGNDKSPIVTQINNHIYIGARLNGMGVALGSNIGKQLADMMLNSQ
ncbi:MAG: NAD(P)/FAD-dependent oxidoreductase [Candidatus Methylacidiphilales bacterium]